MTSFNATSTQVDNNASSSSQTPTTHLHIQSLTHNIQKSTLRIFFFFLLSLLIVIVIVSVVILEMIYGEEKQPGASGGGGGDDGSQDPFGPSHNSTDTSPSRDDEYGSLAYSLLARFVPWTVLLVFVGSVLLCLMGWKSLDLMREVAVQRKRRRILKRNLRQMELEELQDSDSDIDEEGFASTDDLMQQREQRFRDDDKSHSDASSLDAGDWRRQNSSGNASSERLKRSSLLSKNGDAAHTSSGRHAHFADSVS